MRGDRTPSHFVAQVGHVVFAAEALGGLVLIAGIHMRWMALLSMPIALGGVPGAPSVGTLD